MKITLEHYNHMKTEIKKVVELKGPAAIEAHKESLKLNPKVKNLDKRFRWDMFNAACLVRFTCENIYSYANDDHIDTALKSIIKEVL